MNRLLIIAGTAAWLHCQAASAQVVSRATPINTSQVRGLAPGAKTHTAKASDISGAAPNVVLSGVPNSALANSSITINAGAGLTTSSPSVSLGTSTTLTRSVVLSSQAGTAYMVSNTDQASLLTFNNTQAVAVTLPQASAAGQFAANWFADFENLGTGSVTITPMTSTINGGASIALATNQGIRVISDGSNYQIFGLHATNLAATGPGGVTGLLPAASVSGLAASATTDTTNATNISGGTLNAALLPGLTGDLTSTPGSGTTTLATVNSSSGTCGDATHISQLTTNPKGLVTSQSAVPISANGSAPAVQINGNPLGTASMINFGSGSGFTFSGSLSGSTATITGSASSGSAGSVTTGTGAPSSGCKSSSNLGALYLQTNTASPALWICGYNGSTYLWTQIKDNTINVVSLGADPSGSTDSTSAIQAAFNAKCIQACSVEFPAGKFKITRGLTLPISYTSIKGQGKFTSIIDYEPSSAGTALTLSTSSPSSTDLVGVSVRGLGIYSGNVSVQKVGLQIVACSRCTIDDFSVYGSSGNFTGSTSVGIQTKGHEMTQMENIFVEADLPIEISANPDTYGGIQLDMDQWRWEHVYVIANGNPDILVDTETVLTSDRFDGLELVKGTYGFYWNNSETAASSFLDFVDFRTEQGTCSSCPSIYMANSRGQIQHVTFRSVSSDLNRAGMYLRNTYWFQIDHMTYVGRGVWADINSSNSRFNITHSSVGHSATEASGTSISVASDGYVNTSN